MDYLCKKGEISWEDYKEVIKLLKSKLEEKEQELERERKSFKYKLMCAQCGNLVSPVLTEDNHILCPIFRNELGKITPDCRLELTPTRSGEKGVVLRERRDRNNEKETGEIQGEAREEAREREQED